MDQKQVFLFGTAFDSHALMLVEPVQLDNV